MGLSRGHESCPAACASASNRASAPSTILGQAARTVKSVSLGSLQPGREESSCAITRWTGRSQASGWAVNRFPHGPSPEPRTIAAPTSIASPYLKALAHLACQQGEAMVVAAQLGGDPPVTLKAIDRARALVEKWANG